MVDAEQRAFELEQFKRTNDCKHLFHRISLAGKGSYGQVYQCIDNRTGDNVAVKVLDFESVLDDFADIQQEVMLLATLNSPYIAKYYRSYIRGTELWIAMEYIGGGSAADLLKPGIFGENYIRVLLRDVVKGLEYLHGIGVIHRDIKTSNIMLSNTGNVKLVDFGVSAQLEKSSLGSARKTVAGTPLMMAPEMILETGYNDKIDIWAVGITALELAYGKPPRSEFPKERVLMMTIQQEPPKLVGNFSEDFKDFVEKCLIKVPNVRPNASQLLKHPFIAVNTPSEVLKDLVDRWQLFRRNLQKRSSFVQVTRARSIVDKTNSKRRETNFWDFDDEDKQTVEQSKAANDFKALLEHYNLGPTYSVFANNDVDLQTFTLLREEDLVKMGFSVGKVRLIENVINRINNKLAGDGSPRPRRGTNDLSINTGSGKQSQPVHRRTIEEVIEFPPTPMTPFVVSDLLSPTSAASQNDAGPVSPGGRRESAHEEFVTFAPAKRDAGKEKHGVHFNAEPAPKPSVAFGKPSVPLPMAPSEPLPTAEPAKAAPAVFAKPAVLDAKPMDAKPMDAKPMDAKSTKLAADSKATPEVKPATTDTKPTTTNAKPVATDAKPVVSEPKPIAPSPKPTVSEAKPAQTEPPAEAPSNRPAVRRVSIKMVPAAQPETEPKAVEPATNAAAALDPLSTRAKRLSASSPGSSPASPSTPTRRKSKTPAAMEALAGDLQSQPQTPDDTKTGFSVQKRPSKATMEDTDAVVSPPRSPPKSPHIESAAAPVFLISTPSGADVTATAPTGSEPSSPSSSKKKKAGTSSVKRKGSSKPSSQTELNEIANGTTEPMTMQTKPRRPKTPVGDGDANGQSASIEGRRPSAAKTAPGTGRPTRAPSLAPSESNVSLRSIKSNKSTKSEGRRTVSKKKASTTESDSPLKKPLKRAVSVEVVVSDDSASNGAGLEKIQRHSTINLGSVQPKSKLSNDNGGASSSLAANGSAGPETAQDSAPAAPQKASRILRFFKRITGR